jgi:hypothetical protein
VQPKASCSARQSGICSRCKAVTAANCFELRLQNQFADVVQEAAVNPRVIAFDRGPSHCAILWDNCPTDQLWLQRAFTMRLSVSNLSNAEKVWREQQRFDRFDAQMHDCFFQINDRRARPKNGELTSCSNFVLRPRSRAITLAIRPMDGSRLCSSCINSIHNIGKLGSA